MSRTSRQRVDHELLVQLVDVLLVDEAALDVELGELGLAVSTQVLVPEAAGDLVVALDARDHEQLLEQLRRLRQCVERCRGCNRDGTRKSRAPSGVDRVSNGVSMSRKPLASITRRMIPVTSERMLHRAGDGGPAQVEVAVLQPHRLVRVDPSSSGNGGVLGLRQDLDVGGCDLDLARVQRGVGHALRAHPHHARDADDVLAAQAVDGLRRRVGLRDDLDDPAAVAQIEERLAAVVTARRDPPGKGDLVPVVLAAQVPAPWLRKDP